MNTNQWTCAFIPANIIKRSQYDFRLTVVKCPFCYILNGNGVHEPADWFNLLWLHRSNVRPDFSPPHPVQNICQCANDFLTAREHSCED